MSKSIPAWGDYKPDISKARDRGHRCEKSLPEAAYGKAITYCYEDEDGKLWITNEEYASPPSFVLLRKAKQNVGGQPGESGYQQSP